MFDYGVIGAGISGVSAALILARHGYRVALVERAARTAPLLRGFQRDGVPFSPGFHYTGGLASGEVLDGFFRYLGIAGEIEAIPLDPDGYDRVRMLEPSFEFRFPTGREALRERLHGAFPGEEVGIDTYLDEVDDMYRAFPYLNLDAPLEAIGVLERMRGPTLKEHLAGLTRDDRLAAVLSAHCFLHGVPSDEVAFRFHAGVVGSYYRGAHALRGGGESLARACDTALARAGVEVRCGIAVRGVALSSDGAVRGVELAGGERVDCRGVIATIHPALLTDLLPEGAFRPTYHRRLGELEESLTAVIGYAICEGIVPGLRRSNLYVLVSPKPPGFRQEAPLAERPLYINPAELPDDAGTRSGFTVICPVPAASPFPWASVQPGERPPAYRAVKEGLTHDLRAHLERCCPEVAARVHSFEVATPLTLREVTGGPAGGLYGVKHRVGQYNPLPQTRVPGLWLAGQAVAAPGVLGATLSAFLTCGNILGHQRLREDLKRCA